MRSRMFITAILSFLFLCAVNARAAELKSDLKEGEQQRTGRRIIPTPPDRRMNPIADLVGRCAVLDGHHYGGLTIFPVQVHGYGIGVSPLTLDEALARNAIVITEKGAGQVPALIVENRSSQYIFIMAGEILVGGKQNRILREDVLLPPNSGPIELPAYCVEQGRWVKSADGFKSDGNLASSGVRFRAQKAMEQGAIWNGVAETARELRQESTTQDFNYVYNQGEVAAQLGAYRKEFCRVMPREIIGVVVARNGEFVGADLFGDASLFFRLRSKVLDSYAVDVLNRAASVPYVPDRIAAQRFLERVFGAHYSTQGTPGAGVIGRAVGNGIDAKGLIWSERVMHASLFPAVTILPAPMRE